MFLYLQVSRERASGVRVPFFRCEVTLAIPNISMQPALDEVQQAVNKAAQMVLGTAKGVAQWSKERKSKVSYILSTPPPPPPIKKHMNQKCFSHYK